MKKNLKCLTALCMAGAMISLTGCGSSSQSTSADTTAGSASSEATTSAESTAFRQWFQNRYRVLAL